jgi:hypothetical protein
MCRNSQFSPNILPAVLYVSNVISIIKIGGDEGAEKLYSSPERHAEQIKVDELYGAMQYGCETR